jgi:hypothetical protein
MATISATSLIATGYPAWEDCDENLPDLGAAQFISGSNIDHSKLMTLLRTKFGAAAYDTHVSLHRVSS